MCNSKERGLLELRIVGKRVSKKMYNVKKRKEAKLGLEEKYLS